MRRKPTLRAIDPGETSQHKRASKLIFDILDTLWHPSKCSTYMTRHWSTRLHTNCHWLYGCLIMLNTIKTYHPLPCFSSSIQWKYDFPFNETENNSLPSQQLTSNRRTAAAILTLLAGNLETFGVTCSDAEKPTKIECRCCHFIIYTLKIKSKGIFKFNFIFVY